MAKHTDSMREHKATKAKAEEKNGEVLWNELKEASQKYLGSLFLL